MIGLGSDKNDNNSSLNSANYTEIVCVKSWKFYPSQKYYTSSSGLGMVALVNGRSVEDVAHSSKHIACVQKTNQEELLST